MKPPTLHLKGTAKARKCAKCGAPIVKDTRWTADAFYWGFAPDNCEKRKGKKNANA